MQKQYISKPDIKLVGLSVITRNADERQLATAKIGPLINRFLSNNMASTILQRKNPGVLYSVYTEYENDHNGYYTYFVGEEVTSFEDISPRLSSITLPASQYQRFTTEPGKIPENVIQAWQSIWAMDPKTLGGERSYLADFEIYAEGAKDPANAVVDIYIGIKYLSSSDVCLPT